MGPYGLYSMGYMGIIARKMGPWPLLHGVYGDFCEEDGGWGHGLYSMGYRGTIARKTGPWPLLHGV